MRDWKSGMQERQRQWAYYQDWAQRQPPLDPRSFEEILRDLDVLYFQFSEEVRRLDPDPEKLGIQAMRRVFELHEQRRQRS